MGLFTKVFGDPNARAVTELDPTVAKIREYSKSYEALGEDQLKAKTEEFKRRVQKDGETLDDVLPEAFGVVVEAMRRLKGKTWSVRDIDTTWNMVPFDVQLVGGIVLHQGKIAEMRTGEGKTLVAVLPAYLNALAGKGVHVVTVNEYLSQRDAEWMGGVYNYLGLSVGVTLHGQSPQEKHEAYRADITYGTNHEMGFDYLRDNMVHDVSRAAQRGHGFAIVDEVDSILIDEARTPLIISAPAQESTEQYSQMSRIAEQLVENKDYNVDEKLKAATLSEDGISRVEQLLGIKNLYEEGGIRMVTHVEAAVRARALFKRDKDYVVRDNQVVIVDEFTGRLMPGRRYSEGLHQAIEAKEGVEVQRESRTLATITFQNYFRLYDKLSGMTGTAATEAEEFSKIYSLDVVVVPTHKPLVRLDAQDRIYKNEHGKYGAVVREITERHQKGQPVLVGTVSVAKSERVGELLSVEGVEHQVLNAKNHEREAQIISQAGQRGAVTISTNMAGRGTDIKLGEGVVELGGLHVIGTERHEARRVDNQLRGRSGRQGDPGSTQFFVSMEDDMMRIFGSDRMKSMMDRLGVPEEQAIENRIISRSIESAQKKVEGHNFDIRKHLVEFDDVLNKQREVIYSKRHEILELWELEKKRIKQHAQEAPTEQPISGETLKERVLKLIRAEVEQIVQTHTSGDKESRWDIKEICETIRTLIPAPTDLSERLDQARSRAGTPRQDQAARQAIIEYLMGLVQTVYSAREKELGFEMMRRVELGVYLATIDTLWVDHLDSMEALRESVRLRGYGQRDPLVEYKKDGFTMFERLLDSIQNGIVYRIFKAGIRLQQTAPTANAEQLSSSPGGKTARATLNKKIQPGRNEACPCGSGKKYKKCHGAGQS
ncbi:MAG: preprotein translocase subunit SecA [bacterium]|nr:preprotein translocase subunit SecA [bacterium]